MIVTEEIHTTSKPTGIRLSVDRKEIVADAHDIANIKVEIIDENGFVVPDADNLIDFKVEGEGVLKGTDNGNPQDKSQMQSKLRNAFNGLALAVIQSTQKGGTVRLTTVSEGLKEAAIEVNSKTINTK